MERMKCARLDLSSLALVREVMTMMHVKFAHSMDNIGEPDVVYVWMTIVFCLLWAYIQL
jgi:hypothetical protein